MPRLSTAMVRSEGVTLVEMRVEAASRHQVRLAVRADGPVWPPRDDDSNVRWENGTATLEVGAGATGVGCATPAPQGSVETELVAAEPVDDGLPEGVAAWLERVEERVTTAERVAGADDLESAAAVVASVGGLAAVEALAADLARDRRLMSQFGFVPAELCERANAIELPVRSLATVAGPDARGSVPPDERKSESSTAESDPEDGTARRHGSPYQSRSSR